MLPTPEKQALRSFASMAITPITTPRVYLSFWCACRMMSAGESLSAASPKISSVCLDAEAANGPWPSPSTTHSRCHRPARAKPQPSPHSTWPRLGVERAATARPSAGGSVPPRAMQRVERRTLSFDAVNVEGVRGAHDGAQADAQAAAGGMAVARRDLEVGKTGSAIHRHQFDPGVVAIDERAHGHGALLAVLHQVGRDLRGDQRGPPEVGLTEPRARARVGHQPPDFGDLAGLMHV